VEGLSEVKIDNFEEAIKLISKGEKNRAIRKTLMNAKSSRSHTILKITIEAYDTGEG